jgi:hypothetical protein
MEELAASREVVRRIVARSDLDAFTDELLESFWERPEYRRFRPPAEDVRAWVRWNVELVIRWLADGQPPTEAELERFRERARALADAGMPADVVPANFRRGARFAWNAILDAAHEDERPALLASAGLLFDYVDRVSQLFSDTYDAAGDAVEVSTEERRARALLARLTGDAEPGGDEHALAEQIGFELSSPYRPFVLAAPSLSAHQRAALAARLRSQHVLATAEGRRVAGLAHAGVDWRALDIGANALHATGDPTARDRLADALDELRMVVEVAASRGRTGPVVVDDHLAELMLRRSPRLAARTRRRVYGPLDDELARTLDLLIENDFDRAATAAALPVHRNTLINRVHRIQALTGIDVDRADGRALAWLAWLERHGHGAGADTAAAPALTVTPD